MATVHHLTGRASPSEMIPPVPSAADILARYHINGSTEARLRTALEVIGRLTVERDGLACAVLVVDGEKDRLLDEVARLEAELAGAQACSERGA